MVIFKIKNYDVLIDDEDLILISKYKWWITPQGYACTKIRLKNGKRKTMGMHRIILGDPPSQAIDHTNRNKLDNRKCNLVACTHYENIRNRPMFKNKTSIYRGVSSVRGKWQVVVRVDGKLKWLGQFKDEEEARKIAEPYFHGIPA